MVKETKTSKLSSSPEVDLSLVMNALFSEIHTAINRADAFSDTNDKDFVEFLCLSVQVIATSTENLSFVTAGAPSSANGWYDYRKLVCDGLDAAKQVLGYVFKPLSIIPELITYNPVKKLKTILGGPIIALDQYNGRSKRGTFLVVDPSTYQLATYLITLIDYALTRNDVLFLKNNFIRSTVNAVIGPIANAMKQRCLFYKEFNQLAIALNKPNIEACGLQLKIQQLKKMLEESPTGMFENNLLIAQEKWKDETELYKRFKNDHMDLLNQMETYLQHRSEVAGLPPSLEELQIHARKAVMTVNASVNDIDQILLNHSETHTSVHAIAFKQELTTALKKLRSPVAENDSIDPGVEETISSRNFLECLEHPAEEETTSSRNFLECLEHPAENAVLQRPRQDSMYSCNDDDSGLLTSIDLQEGDAIQILHNIASELQKYKKPRCIMNYGIIQYAPDVSVLEIEKYNATLDLLREIQNNITDTPQRKLFNTWKKLDSYNTLFSAHNKTEKMNFFHGLILSIVEFFIKTGFFKTDSEKMAKKIEQHMKEVCVKYKQEMVVIRHEDDNSTTAGLKRG